MDKREAMRIYKVKPNAYGFSIKLLPAGSSKTKVNEELPVAQALNFSRKWSRASAVCGSALYMNHESCNIPRKSY